MTEKADNSSTTDQNKRDLFLNEIRADICHLTAFSNRGLWAMSLFMLVSMIAWRDFPLFPLPGTVRASLGAPPAPHIISLVLLFYTFSAVILSLSRMTGGVKHKSSFCHVGYLTGFFLFYYFAGALNDNYWAVFGAGMTILCVESYRIWSYCKEAIIHRQEQLEYLEKTGRMPIED